MLPLDVVRSMSDSPLNESTMTGQVESHSESEQPVIGPGAQLAAHRQSLGLTVEQVANQLNLAPRQIQALEADNYAALPGVVIARGFVRAYAKLIKLDPAPLVALMPGETAQMESIQLKQALAGSFSGSSLPTAVNKGWLPKWAGALVLLLVIGVGASIAQWFGLLHNFSESLSDNSGKAAVSLSQTSNMPTPTAAKSAPETRDAGSPSKDEIAKPLSAVPPSNQPAAQSEQATTSPGVPGATSSAAGAIPAPNAPGSTQSSLDNRSITPAASETPSVSNKNMLTFTVRDDSWVEVKSSNGNVLISRLLKAGSSEALSLAHPVSITIGNATGVDVTLRGNAIDLKQATKNNVARLNLK
jgi:cytoskeleton protein RodZ